MVGPPGDEPMGRRDVEEREVCSGEGHAFSRTSIVQRFARAIVSNAGSVTSRKYLSWHGSMRNQLRRAFAVRNKSTMPDTPPLRIGVSRTLRHPQESAAVGGAGSGVVDEEVTGAIATGDSKHGKPRRMLATAPAPGIGHRVTNTGNDWRTSRT